MDRKSGLVKFSWFVLAYNVGVIIFGAFVRATGSGAGCGAHWPLCNGVVVPQSPALTTMIEFTHRITSGITILLLAALVIWVWRSYPRGHLLRKTSGLSAFFIVTESLIGAGLVLFQLVENEASVARAISMAAHLMNTFLLLACLLLTAWWLTVGIPEKTQSKTLLRVFSSIGVVGLLILGASGAVTALGDTLFPSTSLAEGLRQDLNESAHFLIRLRVLHPLLAILVGSYVAGFGLWLRGQIASPALKAISTRLAGLVGLQFLLGGLNVILLAPVWLQLVHLGITTLIWLHFILVVVFAWVAPDLVVRIAEDNIHDRINQAASG